MEENPVKMEEEVVEENASEEAMDTNPSPAMEATPDQYDRSQLPDLLRVYYTWLFPFDKYFDWLQYGNKDTFSHREFSFTLKDDVYVRYQSYDSRESLEEGIKQTLPYKIDIGAIFSVKVLNFEDHLISFFTIVELGTGSSERKELVFDIDMTDYDDIRTCCQEANICSSCWKFIVIAIRIIDRALREDFGFKHLLWVYSGRRGVHCWVCDKEAMQLSQEARTAIVEYLSLIKGGEQQAQKVKLPSTLHPLHPSISSALNIVDHYFTKLLEEQGFLSTPERWNKILALIPSGNASKLNEEWQETPASSCARWGRLKHTLQKVKGRHLQEIKLQWSYPRLDVNVSKGINHLLKSPLCVHPKTGRVCVPIDITKLDSFDPFAVPTVSQLCHEFDSIASTNGNQKPQKLAYMKTSLRPYMEFFRDRFLNPLIQESNIKRRKAEKTLDF